MSAIPLYKNVSCTITYGDVAENNVGMQQIGDQADEGFDYQDLKNAQLRFEEQGYNCQLINLSNQQGFDSCIIEKEEAYILIIQNGVKLFLGNHSVDDLFREQSKLEWDTKAFMRGKVKNKIARYNLCYDEKQQEPCYEEKRGRIIAYQDVPLLNSVKNSLEKIFGPKACNLKAEGNYYYNSKKCYIGQHGDTERKKVIAIRLGCDMSLDYQWFHRFKPVSNVIEFNLKHGDMYMMSQKAVGTDWKKSSIYTLRHSAGVRKI